MKFFVTLPRGEIRDTFFTPDNAALITAFGETVWHEGTESCTPEELVRGAKEADAVILCWGSPKITPELLAKLPKLKVIVHLGATVTPYVDSEVYDRGVAVLSGNDFYAESVAEGVIAYMLAAQRDIPYYSGEMRKGNWVKGYNRGLLDRTVGLVSFGGIARRVAEMLSVFRVNIKVYSRHIDESTLDAYHMQRADLDEIFSTCDVISVHTALVPATVGMIDRRLLSLIRKDALFINTARGAVVDEDALVEFLRAGRFRAVLDVFTQEPLPAENGLRECGNALLMPHMGGPTVDRRRYITTALLKETADFLTSGVRPAHEIDRMTASAMSAF